MFKIMKKGLTALSAYPRLRILLILAFLMVVFVVLLNVFSSSAKAKIALDGGAPPSHNGSQSGSYNQHVTISQANNYQRLDGHQVHQQLAAKVESGQSLFNFSFKSPSEIEHALEQHISPTAQALQKREATRGGLDTRIHEVQQAIASHDVLTPIGPSKQNEDSQNQNGPSGSNQEMQAQAAMAEQQALRSAIQSASSSWRMPKFATEQGQVAQSAQPIKPTSSVVKSASIKAGDIMFAVMDITADSDQINTPVLATIATGKYRGARLMGSFTLEKDKLVIKFNLMTMPSWPNSVSINAYAVDSQTAQAAMANYVNHHYLFRYGSLFAAAFLEGFGNAFNSYSYSCPPGSTTCVVTGGESLQNQKVTSKTAIFQGLGNVGSQLSNAAQENFNTLPTVKVFSGTGVGVLFMQDEYIPYPGNQQEMYGKESL